MEPIKSMDQLTNSVFVFREALLSKGLDIERFIFPLTFEEANQIYNRLDVLAHSDQPMIFISCDHGMGITQVASMPLPLRPDPNEPGKVWITLFGIDVMVW